MGRRPVDEDWCPSVAPIQPHEMTDEQRKGMDRIVRRVAANSVMQGRGQDLLLRVYLAGMYHAMEVLENA